MKKLFGLLSGLFAVMASVPVFAAAGTPGESSMLVTLVPFIIMIVAMYFLLIRPQKKREKETRNMLNSLAVGDEIVTIGGVIGKVVKVKEDKVVIETGSDCVKIAFERGAVGRITKKNEKKSKEAVSEANKELEAEKQEKLNNEE